MYEWEQSIHIEHSPEDETTLYALQIPIDEPWYTEPTTAFRHHRGAITDTVRSALIDQGLIRDVSYDAASFIINTGLAYFANSADSIRSKKQALGDFDGVVGIRILFHDGKLRFIMEDNGIGLDESQTAALFHAGIMSTKSDAHLGGAGQALATAGRAGEQFDAVFGFENKGPGNGAQFWFEIPVANLSIGTPMDQVSRILRPL